ncbi:MAG TPA: cobalamin biosynthesis protein CbiM [Ruminococcaceae bacterium]|nr:cobalamin biosynthesis protein CbiM [Oscillospiraceae bacterium]
MHIPDGYLSPQTTIPVLAGMIPVWAVAFQRVKKFLSNKRIPTLALCAAFAFVIMMFNIPVAGGSSAHAVGAVFIAILLGPWAATISVSTALLIQALVFGDGGILAFGVNCLNMAVIMPFVGYYLYRLIAGRSKPGSRRNLVGAFFGGYVGINVAAICAGFELGIQPLLFKSANGTPLYCPYPLSVSVPSMSLAHAVFAGPLEAIVTVVAIAYLVKFAPHLFKKNQFVLEEAPQGSIWKRYRAFFIPLIVLGILTPLGLITSGTAWGEWGADELKEQLGYVPKGFAAIADKWHALLPDYGLPFSGGQTMSILGYVLSAVVGMAIIAGLIFFTYKMVTKSQKQGNGHS